jgi:hypothetical protein
MFTRVKQTTNALQTSSWNFLFSEITGAPLRPQVHPSEPPALKAWRAFRRANLLVRAM